MDNRCVGCGEIVPEGRQVCPNCEKGRMKMADKLKGVEIDPVREKFIKLLCRAPCESELEGQPGSCPYRKHGLCGEVERLDYCAVQRLADRLIANGVTVGKPLSQFLHPVDAYAGLKAKYLVFKGDTGEKVENCFVLRPDKDPAAVEALRAYARTTENQTLAEDICNWVGRGEPVQEWIPVTERLPVDDGRYIVTACDEGCSCGDGIWYSTVVLEAEYYKGTWTWNENGTEYDITCFVTHWMPLPEPPKGECL